MAVRATEVGIVVRVLNRMLDLGRPTIVARGLLPSHAPAFGDDPEMLVTLRWGGLNSGTRYHPLTRWHNHRSTRVTLSNCTINVVSVVSPIADE
jgi:hypothetical protein